MRVSGGSRAHRASLRLFEGPATGSAIERKPSGKRTGGEQGQRKWLATLQSPGSVLLQCDRAHQIGCAISTTLPARVLMDEEKTDERRGG